MKPKEPLSDAELRRYRRHFNLDEVGVAGQQRLKESSVLLVGLGGLGAPLSMYLAAAGVGRIGLIEFDEVEESNLQRQILYEQGDIGASKLEVAARRLERLNPHVEIVRHAERFCVDNAAERVAAYDVVADGSDNFATRYLVNDACVLGGRPNVFGAILRFEGQLSVFAAEDGPCYRCLFPEPPPPGLIPNCAEGGVLGILPGIIGSMQANEVVKLLLGVGRPMIGRFLTFDALEMSFREIKLKRSPTCPVCSPEGAIRELKEYAVSCAPPAAELESSVTQLSVWRQEGALVQVIDVREPHEWQIARIEGAELIPLRELPGRVGEISTDQTVVVYCHHGVRSLQAVDYLRSEGFENSTSLQGGIDHWSCKIDTTVPRY